MHVFVFVYLYLCSMLIWALAYIIFSLWQTVVDELSVCTINLENDPTYEDLSSSNECEFVIDISIRNVTRHRTQMSSNIVAKSILVFVQLVALKYQT